MNLGSSVRYSDGWHSVRVVGRSIAAAAVGGLLAASSASAVTAPRTVALHVTVNGSGTVRVPGNPAFTCSASFPGSSHCRHTFQVRKGRRIVLKESPASGWKLWSWTGACHGSAASCSLRVKARRFGFVTASFVPPGDRLNPYPLGMPVPLSDPANTGWRMTVNSLTPNANAQVEAANGNVPPPPGHQYAVVNLSLTLLNGGPIELKDFTMGRLLTEAHNHDYLTAECTAPSPDLTKANSISSGQTVTGNLCFVIFTTDARKLELSANDEVTTAYGVAAETRWFALHK
jgi:hypothetical protein